MDEIREEFIKIVNAGAPKRVCEFRVGGGVQGRTFHFL